MSDPTIGSGEWFEKMTRKQLREQMRGGGPGNAAYEGARNELQRRDADRQGWWVIATFAVSVIAAIAGVAALF